MKRELDLLRLILIEAEKRSDSPHALNDPIEIAGHSYKEVVGHIRLLEEAGLIEAQDWGTMECEDWRVRRLTNAGHDFLAAARDDSLWNRAKQQLGPVIATVGVKVLGEALAHLAKSAMMNQLH